VIPVLQQLFPECEDSKSKVDGWRTDFYSDLDNLPNVWPEFGMNVSTMGELWIGFLGFYSGSWDTRRNVVAIRQREALIKEEKSWFSEGLAIEDPFNLSHNLGGRLSQPDWLCIQAAFQRTWDTFSLPSPQIVLKIHKLLFNPDRRKTRRAWANLLKICQDPVLNENASDSTCNLCEDTVEPRHINEHLSAHAAATAAMMTLRKDRKCSPCGEVVSLEEVVAHGNCWNHHDSQTLVEEKATPKECCENGEEVLLSEATQKHDDCTWIIIRQGSSL